jgi:hypothetical protein
MAQLSRNDVQQIVDNAKNRIIERVATRQDLQTVTDTARDRVMTYTYDLVQMHQQQMIRRMSIHSTNMQRQVSSLEARIMAQDQELKTMRQLLERIANNEPQRIYLPVQQDQNVREGYTQEYSYRTA